MSYLALCFACLTCPALSGPEVHVLVNPVPDKFLADDLGGCRA